LSACGGVDGDAASTSIAGAAPTTATGVTQTTEVAPTTDLSTLDVSGTYQFVGEVPNTMKGTITFEQEGDLVRVTGTKYENNASRELKGEATIKGTRLEIVLVPINDDPTYEAEVLFIFSEDGDTFEVSFMDTNGDEGDMGSYTGVRQ
jgi:hypothetical protein